MIPKAAQSAFFDDFNVPVWKTKENGHTLIRGLRPRKNEPFLVAFEGQDEYEKINCIEVTKEMQAGMD